MAPSPPVPLPHPPSPAAPWFGPDEQCALQDFWRVYAEWFDRIEDRAESNLGGVRDILDDGVRTGDWRPYGELLVRRGERSAGLGSALPLALTPHLVRVYLEHPDRLVAALAAMSRFVEQRAAVLAEAATRADETASQTTERSLAITLASIGDGVIATDARGRIERMNPVARELTCWSLGDALGMRLDEVFRVMDEDTGQVVPSRVDEVIRRRAGINLPRHCSLVARDGSIRPVSDSMAPIRDDAGMIHGVVVVFRDLSQERAHERAVELHRARMAAILEASLDAVLVLDGAGHVTDSNASAERMFGRTLRGERFPDLLVHRSGRGSGAVQMEALAASLGTRREMRARRADGTEFPVDLALVKIPDDGEVSFTCFVRDLTEAHAAQQALTESHQQLRSLAGRIESCREEERTRIARELHDELGQQLTAIRMDIGWLTPRQRAPEVVERLAAMSQLVDGTFAAVRRLGTELRPGILDNLGLVDALEWQANEFEERSRIRVNLEISGEVDDLDPGRCTAVFRIFQEVLTNVARHAGARNVVSQLTVDESRLTLEVVDDGRGIRPEELRNPTSLGLIGMRERATLYGGTFRIEPIRGGGTLVSVSLPRREGSPP